MSRTYTANYKGKRYDMTVKAWHRFLSDKPVFDHITYNCMRLRLKKRAKTNLSIGQCLGITEHQAKHSGKKKESPAVSQTEMGKFLLINNLLKTVAKRRTACQS